MTHHFCSPGITIFPLKISKFCYIKKYGYRMNFNAYILLLLTFLEPLKFALIKMLAILMMSAKLATLGLLKKRYLKMKFMTSWFLSLLSSTKYYHVTQTILQMLPCDKN